MEHAGGLDQGYLNNPMQGYYIFILVFLLASAVIVPIFQRYRISGVLGFLLVGVLLGPAGIGAIEHFWPPLAAFNPNRGEAVAHLAELGVVFLMFSIGLELTLDRLKAMRKMVFGLGIGQIVLCSIGLFGLFYLMGQSVISASILGMALALSSTAVIIPVLADRKTLNTTSGRSVFAVLLAQDVAVAPIMITTAMLTGAASGQAVGVKGLLTLIPALLGIGLLFVLGRVLLRPLFNSVAFSKSRELFMAACLLVILVSGQLAVASGLSMALGAFIAGILLGETEYRREIELMIQPFQGLLLGLFFVTVGARLDLAEVLVKPQLVLGLAIGLIIIKAAIIYPIARRFGLGKRAAFEAAAILGPAGEFAFVIIDQAIAHHVLGQTFGQAVILSAIISLLAIPLVAEVGARVVKAVSKMNDVLPEVAPEHVVEGADVLVVGYGRVGELVCDMLTQHRLKFSVIDINPKVTQRARAKGVSAWFGDASNPEFLHLSGLDTARAIVVTASNASFTDQVVKAVSSLRQDVMIVARARDAHHAERLYAMGATDAVPETIEASLQLAENTLIELGVPMGLVLASIHERRDDFRKAFGIRDDLKAQSRARALRSRVKS